MSRIRKFTVAYETERHHDQCPQAKLDDRVEELIKELKDVCYELEPFDNKSVSAEVVLLQEQVPKIKAWKIMQFFPEAGRLTDEQRGELLEKVQLFVEQDEDEDEDEDKCEDKCEACRKNMLCLITAPALTIIAVRENLDLALRDHPGSPEVDRVQDQIELLVDRAIYIQSRASDLYYGGLILV